MEFKVLDENGNSVECELLYTFKDPKSGINYILYTDGTKNENDELEVYASRYELVNDNYVLKSIESDSEWDMVDEVLGEFLNK